MVRLRPAPRLVKHHADADGEPSRPWHSDRRPDVTVQHRQAESFLITADGRDRLEIERAKILVTVSSHTFV